MCTMVWELNATSSLYMAERRRREASKPESRRLEGPAEHMQILTGSETVRQR